MGHEHFRPGSVVSGHTIAQERYSFCQIAIFDLDPAAKDCPLARPVREILFGGHRSQLVYPLAQDCIGSGKRSQSSAYRQARGQSRLMSSISSLRYCCVTPCQCLVGKAETEQDDCQNTCAFTWGLVPI